jgi:hypothetical protein
MGSFGCHSYDRLHNIMYNVINMGKLYGENYDTRGTKNGTIQGYDC